MRLLFALMIWLGGCAIYDARGPEEAAQADFLKAQAECRQQDYDPCMRQKGWRPN